MQKCYNNSPLSDVKLMYIKKNLQGEVILDVGAGYCYYSEWLIQNSPHLKVVSIDQLDLISQNGIEFLNLNLENPLPLEDNSFSSILAFDIIEHINNDEMLIDELYRICKPGGIIIGSVPHNDDKFLPKYNLTFYHRSDLTHKRYYVPSTLTESLEKSGFKDITVDARGGVSPQVIAEFFPMSCQFFVKKSVGLMRRLGIIDGKALASDLFFVAHKPL